MNHRIFHIFITLLMLATATSCQEDKLFSDPEIGEGTALIEGTVLFQSFTPALESRAAGNIIHDINDMQLFIYSNDEQTLLLTHYFAKGASDWSINQNGNTEMPDDISEPDGVSYDQSETSTPEATFSLTVPYGRYKMYIVANMGSELSADDYPTADELKAIKLTWNNSDIAANNQMFGYLTPNDAQSSTGFEAPPVIVNQANVKLHSWIKRAASKVTVAYDTSNLKESVRIYIQKVSIYDIPASCTLGEYNKPESASDLYSNENPQTIYYQDGATSTDYKKWMVLAHSPSDPELYGSSHSNTANALFFYENMQGDYSGQKKYNKVMQDDVMFGDDPIREPDQDDYKDEVRLGTYIEVSGFYDSFNGDRVTSGPIKYRFMLGKNVTYNYDAERNHHYKLTLKFTGFANEADWHIDYEDEEPAIYTPDKYYISYLYNEQMGSGLPVRLTGKPKSLKAEITTNYWAPCDETTDTVPMSNNPGGDFWWSYTYAYQELNKIYKLGASSTTSPKYNYNDFNGNTNFVGFLGLRANEEPTNILPGATGDDKGYGTNTMYLLLKYYIDHKTNKAEYDLTPGTHNLDNISTYTVTKDEDESITVHVPMWTRSRQLGSMTTFTSNNPYDSYLRKAWVLFTATFDVNGTDVTLHKYVPIYQVHRIVNPLGFIRSKTNPKDFEVVLTYIANPGDTDFSRVKSNGPWRATIKGDAASWLSLESTGSNTTGGGSTIEGVTDSYISFKVKTSALAESGSDRFAMIDVEYNDYTCIHHIFVRQGCDDDVQLVNGGSIWSSKNVYAFNQATNYTATTAKCVQAASPLSLGAYFKRLNYSYSYLDKNDVTYGHFVALESTYNLSVGYINSSGSLVTSESKTWSDLTGASTSGSNYNRTWAATITDINNNREYRVPDYSDFRQLENDQENISYGYGVIYGEGASTTATTISDAYGFLDDDNSGAVQSTKGTRVCLVYNPANCKHILFPMGYRGYGRRSYSNSGWLCYFALNIFLSNSNNNNIYRPNVYDLQNSNGAVYWINKIKSGGHTFDNADCHGWDINYFSFAFTPYDNGSVDASNSDALPIKLVRKTPAAP